MVSKRDLVEARSFGRRRLVAAFLSGAPGGREVEPPRHGRAVVGGLAVSVLLLAGAAIAGIVDSPTPADWRDAGIVVGDRNTTYVILEDGAEPLRLVNVTSGMLLLGHDVPIRSVDQSEIDQVASDRRVGIFGAPEDPPAADELVDTGWTACLASGSIRLRVDDAETTTAAPRGAFFAHSTSGLPHLVVQTAAGAHRLPLPKSQRIRNDLANALRGTPDLGEVPAAWLDLVPAGEPLTRSSFPVEGSGEQAAWAPPGTPPIGAIVSINGHPHLIGDDAPMPLDPFAETVYRTLFDVSEAVETSPLGAVASAVPPSWPTELPERSGSGVGAAEEACLVLDAAPDRAAQVHLGVAPEERASAAGLEGRTRVEVAVGRGALVLSAEHGTSEGGQPWLVDRWGRRYALGGPAGETADHLGYGDHQPVTVPDPWLELFGDCGPELSRELALGTPDLEQQKSSCDD